MIQLRQKERKMAKEKGSRADLSPPPLLVLFGVVLCG